MPNTLVIRYLVNKRPRRRPFFRYYSEFRYSGFRYSSRHLYNPSQFKTYLSETESFIFKARIQISFQYLMMMRNCLLPFSYLTFHDHCLSCLRWLNSLWCRLSPAGLCRSLLREPRQERLPQSCRKSNKIVFSGKMILVDFWITS